MAVLAQQKAPADTTANMSKDEVAHNLEKIDRLSIDSCNYSFEAIENSFSSDSIISPKENKQPLMSDLDVSLEMPILQLEGSPLHSKRELPYKCLF